MCELRLQVEREWQGISHINTYVEFGFLKDTETCGKCYTGM